jgi:hypothetical protein
VSLGGRNALRETATLEVGSLPFWYGVYALRVIATLEVVSLPLWYGVYALRVIATLKVVSQHLIIIPCETTFTEHER